MDFLTSIKQRAKLNPQKVLLPESKDERVLQAASICQQEGFARVVLLGEPKEVLENAKNLKIDLAGVEIISLQKYREELCNLLLELKQDFDKKQALLELQEPLCTGALLLRSGKVQGMVAGARYSSSEVIRAGLNYIERSRESVISGLFLSFCSDDIGENGLLGLADCAVNANPNSRRLVQIAISSAKTMEQLCGVKARIAMLSFSTKKSAEHQLTKKMSEAAELLKEEYPEILVDGELQVDAALVPQVAKIKAPNSSIKGAANMLIFPDLNSGNISYKIIQRIGKAEVIGPILQGFSTPINDLSRGCGVNEVVHMLAITSLQVKK